MAHPPLSWKQVILTEETALTLNVLGRAATAGYV